MSLGLIITLLVMKENTFLSRNVGIQKDRGHRVIMIWPYKIVRHPMYLGFILFIVFYYLALGSLYSLLPVAIGIVGIIILTILEDRILHNQLKGYREYTQEVKKK